MITRSVRYDIFY